MLEPSMSEAEHQEHGAPSGVAASAWLPQLATSIAASRRMSKETTRSSKQFTFTKQSTMHDSVKRPLKIKVYANGNSHFEGKVVVVDKTRIQTIPHLLEFVYPKLQNLAQIPTIKRIYDINSRTNCTEMSQIEHGREYAVAGYESFRNVGYHGIKDRRTLEIEDRKRRMHAEKVRLEKQIAEMKRKQEEQAHPSARGENGSRIQAALKNSKPKIVYFIRNGDERNVTFSMLLNARNCANFNQLCQRVSTKLQLEAPCRWIYTMAGKPVETVRDLEDGGTYVAVGRIAFKQVGYKAAVKPKRIVRVRTRGAGADGGPPIPHRMPSLKHGKDAENILGKPPEARKRKSRTDSLVRAPVERGNSRRSARITTYRITAYTGNVDNAGTDAPHVYLFMVGRDGESDRRQLRDSEDAFKVGGVHTLEVSCTDVGPLISVTLEHDNAGSSAESSAWFVEKVEILDLGKGPTALPSFFWFRRWISSEAGLTTSAPMSTKNSFEEAQSELVDKRKQALLGMDTFQPYSTVLKHVLELTSDAKESKRQWKVIDVESKGFVEATYLWSHIRDLFPELYIPEVLEHCFQRVYRVRNVNEGSMAVKAGFRFYLTTLAYSCQFYEEAGLPEDFSTMMFSKDGAISILQKLEISRTADEFENIYYKLAAEDGDVPFPELMSWYAEHSCSEEIVESQHKKKKDKKKKKKKRRRSGASIQSEDQPQDEEHEQATTFEELERELEPIAQSAEQLEKLWCSVDLNHNGRLSLAEISKMVVDRFQMLNHRPALMRAYEHTTQKDGDGDPWVEIEEFPALLVNLFFFNKMFQTFDVDDVSDQRPLTLEQFQSGVKTLNMNLSSVEAETAFHSLNVQDDRIFFDEFCVWYTHQNKFGQNMAAVAEDLKARNRARNIMKKALQRKALQSLTKKPRAQSNGEVQTNVPKYSSDSFDALEVEVMAAAQNTDYLEQLWDLIDINDNQLVSLAEVDKWVVQQYPLLNNKPALMRAYQQTTLRDGDGDEWVEPHEFPQLLANIFFFNKVFQCFEVVDTSDDRRLDATEFHESLVKLKMSLSKSESAREFKEMDVNGGGVVLFDEFCVWYSKKNDPSRIIVTSAEALKARKNAKKAVKRRRALARQVSEKSQDSVPNLTSTTFDELENEFMSIAKDKDQLEDLWDDVDINDNGKVSLAEIDKVISQKYSLLNHKPALMRAYRQTTLKDGGDGDPWVEIHEFPQLLVNLFYFNKLFQTFDGIDSDKDRRLDPDEFHSSLKKLGMSLSRKASAKEFQTMDVNGGGVVLFDEFCVWYTKKHEPGREIATCADALKARKKAKRAAKKRIAAAKEARRDARNDVPDFTTHAFDALEEELMAASRDTDELEVLWDSIDFNNNDKVSLAEIDKFVAERYPLLNHKPALMRAYQQTTLKDGGDGDDWVEVHEFPMLLINLFHFNKLFQAFDVIDKDDDRRLNSFEFHESLKKLRMSLSQKESQKEFEKIDTNGGGVVLFDEFCVWYTKKHDPGREIITSAEVLQARKKAKRARKKKGKSGRGPRDAIPNFDSSVFDAVETELGCILKDVDKLEELWDAVDVNRNQKVSLAEIDKIVVQRYPVLNQKQALMRAYQQATLRDGGDGDDWVEIREFPQLLLNLLYFNKLYQCFGAVDTDNDRRLDIDEFRGSLKALKMSLSKREAAEEFKAMDANGGGVVLFDEFCVWYTKKHDPGREIITSAEVLKARKKAKRAGEKRAAKAMRKGSRDDIPNFSTKRFDKLEGEMLESLRDADQLEVLWDLMDCNDNQRVSLAEVDKFVVERYPLLNHKPALMRAYQQTTLRDGGDGDDWVDLHEFPQLLVNIFYFSKLYRCFDVIDKDDDRRLDIHEFQASLEKLGMSLNAREADAEFQTVDANGGGVVLFDEFCVWYTKKHEPGRDIITSAEVLKARKKSKMHTRSRTALAKSDPKDAIPEFQSGPFDALEDELLSVVKDHDKLEYLWDVTDVNDNQKVSLAEVDKMVVQTYPLLNNKAALMRAYQQSTLKDGGNGDAWVQALEFPQLLVNLFYFNKLFQAFAMVDSDKDRRLDVREFQQSLQKLGMNLSRKEGAKEFSKMDANGGGFVLFDEFCVWYTRKHDPAREVITSAEALKSRKDIKRKARNGQPAPPPSKIRAPSANKKSSNSPQQERPPPPKLKSFNSMIEDEVSETFPFSESVDMANADQVLSKLATDPDALQRLWARANSIDKSLLAISSDGIFVVDAVSWERTRIGTLNAPAEFRTSCWVGDTAIVFTANSMSALTADGDLKELSKGSWDSATTCVHIGGQRVAVAVGREVYVCDTSSGSSSILIPNIGSTVRALLCTVPSQHSNGDLVCVTDDAVFIVYNGKTTATKVADMDGRDRVLCACRLDDGALIVTSDRTKRLTLPGQVTNLETADWSTVGACVTVGCDTVVIADDYGLYRINVRTGLFSALSESDAWSGTLALMACPVGTFLARGCARVAPPPLYKVSNLLHRTFPSFNLTDAAVGSGHDCANGNIDVDAVEPDNEADSVEVSEDTFFATIVYSYCFVLLFKMFPKLRGKANAVLDISSFTQVCGLLHDKLDSASATDVFEGMETNDGAGSVLVAEVAVWFGQKQYIEVSKRQSIRRGVSNNRRDSTVLIHEMATAMTEPKQIWAAWTGVAGPSPQTSPHCSAKRCADWVRENCKEIYDEQMFQSAVEISCGNGDGRTTTIAVGSFVDVMISFAALVSAGFLTGIDEHSKISLPEFPAMANLLFPMRRFASGELEDVYRDLVRSSSTGTTLFADDLFRWYAREKLKGAEANAARSDFSRRMAPQGGSALHRALQETQRRAVSVSSDTRAKNALWARVNLTGDTMPVDTFVQLLQAEFSVFSRKDVQLNSTDPLVSTIFATAAPHNNVISKDDFGTAIAKTCSFTALRCAAGIPETDAAFLTPIALDTFRSACSQLNLHDLDADSEYRTLQQDSAGDKPLFGSVCEWYTGRVLPE